MLRKGRRWPSESRTQPHRLDQGKPRLSHLSRPGGAAALTPGTDTRHARSIGGIHHLRHGVSGIHGLRTWNRRGRHEMSRFCGAKRGGRRGFTPGTDTRLQLSKSLQPGEDEASHLTPTRDAARPVAEGGRASASSPRPGGDAAPHLAPSRDAARSGTDTRRGSICCGRGGFQSHGLSLIASTRGDAARTSGTITKRGSIRRRHHLAPSRDVARSGADTRRGSICCGRGGFQSLGLGLIASTRGDAARTSGTITRRGSIRRRHHLAPSRDAARSGADTRHGSICCERGGFQSLGLSLIASTREDAARTSGTNTRRGSIRRRHLQSLGLSLIASTRGDAARTSGTITRRGSIRRRHHLRHGKMEYASMHLNPTRRPDE